MISLRGSSHISYSEFYSYYESQNYDKLDNYANLRTSDFLALPQIPTIFMVHTLTPPSTSSCIYNYIEGFPLHT